MQVSVLSLVAFVGALSVAHAATTSGTFTGTYSNITKCTYRYGPTFVPQSQIKTYHFTNSTTGFSQKTTSVKATKYYTPTPRPTVTTTTTSYTNLVLPTSTVTQTVTATQNAANPTTTYTVTTQPGFTPLGKKYPTTSAKPTTASSSSAPAARRATTTISSVSLPKTFTTAAYCTTQVKFVVSKKATVTTGTTTSTLSTATITSTATGTATYYDHFVTTTTTFTVTVQPTYYPGCKSDNIVSKVQMADGSVQPISYYYDTEHFFSTRQDIVSAYDCCTLCQRTSGCLGSAFIADSTAYGEYYGYFGYAGTVCVLIPSRTDDKCGLDYDPKDGPVYGNDNKNAPPNAVVLSNGNCNPGWLIERLRFPGCPYDDIVCQRPGNGY